MCLCTWTSELYLCLASVRWVHASREVLAALAGLGCCAAPLHPKHASLSHCHSDVVLQVPFSTSSMQAVNGPVQKFHKPVQTLPLASAANVRGLIQIQNDNCRKCFLKVIRRLGTEVGGCI